MGYPRYHHEEVNTSRLSMDHEHDDRYLSSPMSTRHSWRFPLRKKKSTLASTSQQFLDRPIPAISISLESQDDSHSTIKQSKLGNENSAIIRSIDRSLNHRLVQYGQKIRSKFGSLKRSSNDRHHLSTQFASAMTKSHQDKMRQWQDLQKSDFLINYRRQSLSPSSRPHRQEIFHLSPILSSNQRSLILHQWREIMSEEMSLRQHQQTLQSTLIKYQQLERQLKMLKGHIFSTSSTAVNPTFHYRQRCQSLQSFVSMPNSWLLAVQSGAYSDILDGTTEKTTEKTSELKREFFHQLEQWKDDRLMMEENLIKHFQLKSINHRILTHGYLHKPLPVLSLPPLFSPLQCKMSTTPRRTRFDLRKTLQRSRSLCLSQLHSWLHRRRGITHTSNHHPISKEEPVKINEDPPDDSDQTFQQRELPIRIYFPARIVSPRSIRINHISTPPPMSKLTSPLLNRRRLNV